MTTRILAAAIAVVLAVLLPLHPGSSALAQTSGSEASTSVVVTTEVLGSVVRELVGDAATVTVLMEGGADPHTWQPSARDSERIFGADIVVANGLGLEEGLEAILARAESEGVLVFHATDHVDVLAPGEDIAEHEDHHDHHDEGDPHFWLDPLAMRDVVTALEPALASAGVDVVGRTGPMIAALDQLDAEVRETLSVIPAERRRLVSGHGSLAYLAARYGFEIIGAVIPGVSTSGEASVRDLADLVATVREAGATAIFSDSATPQSVARAVALDSGATIVELDVARLPDGGSYADLIRGIASTISEALAIEGAETS